jgi:hypothetical protein
MAKVVEGRPAKMGFRMPAEWEPHDQCWMGWPVLVSSPFFFLLLVLIYSSLHACHFFPFSCRCSIGPCFRVETRFISLHNSQLARIASCIILST